MPSLTLRSCPQRSLRSTSSCSAAVAALCRPSTPRPYSSTHTCIDAIHHAMHQPDPCLRRRRPDPSQPAHSWLGLCPRVDERLEVKVGVLGVGDDCGRVAPQSTVSRQNPEEETCRRTALPLRTPALRLLELLLGVCGAALLYERLAVVLRLVGLASERAMRSDTSDRWAGQVSNSLYAAGSKGAGDAPFQCQTSFAACRCG